VSRTPEVRRRIVRGGVTLGGLVALTLGIQWLRHSLGIEWSADSVRAAVAGYGVWAPLTFLALTSVRQLLALPSLLVLTTAGLLFGAGLGTLLGGLGIALNACLVFATARVMGREWVLPRIHARWPQFEQQARSAGPPFIAIMTAHPMGVLTPFYFAAGVTGITAAAFVAAVGPAAFVRAACYSFLGANLLEVGSPRFWLAGVVLAFVAIAPLTHSGVRRRLRGLDQ